jgi:metal-dependent hydrolase (beta-lactamase superfamily II)
MKTIKVKKIYECHFCGENKQILLWNKGNTKVCSTCIKLVLEIVFDAINDENKKTKN